MKSEMPGMLVCAQVAHVPYPFPGSVGATCDRCSVAIWLLPARLKQATELHRGPLKIMCLDCALHIAEVEGDLPELLSLLVRRGMN